MVARKLLIVTALLESATGLTLLLSPQLVAALLLGTSLDAPAALVVGRVAGAALLSAMLLYNSAAVAVLASAGAGVRLAGVFMWPTVALHAALALWCIACLRKGAVTAAACRGTSNS